MNVCPYCSHDNQHEGPCARCGLEGNPSGTPWGIRKDRNTKYWNKYNWNSQTFTDDYGTKEPITAQERDNKVNHDEIMRVIRPHKRDPKKHKHFTASQPAMYDLDAGDTEMTVPPVTELPDPIPITKKEAEEEVEKEKDGEVDWDSIGGDPVGSILTVKEGPFVRKGDKYQLSSKILSAPRYEFSLPPRILDEVGQWSLLDPVFKGMRNINNKVTRTKSQGSNGLCFAFSGVDSAEWLNGKEYAGPYAGALQYNADGLDPLLLRKRIDEGGWPSNTMIMTDINGGQLPIGNLAGSNDLDAFNYYSINNVDMAMIGSLKKHATQVSIPSTPIQWNVTHTKIKSWNKERQWEMISSLVHAGIVSSIAYKVRTDSYMDSLAGKDHYTPKAPYSKGGHAITIWGVKVTNKKLEEIKGTKTEDDVKNNPYFNVVNTAWESSKTSFLEALKPSLSPLNKSIQFVKNRDGNYVMQVMWKGKKYPWNDFKKYHPTEYALINDLKQVFLQPFIYHNPDRSDLDRDDDDGDTRREEEQEFFDLEYEDWTDTRKDVAWKKKKGLDFEGLRRWVLVHNSWGRAWGRDGFIWIDFDAWSNDLRQIDTYTQTTADYNVPKKDDKDKKGGKKNRGKGKGKNKNKNKNKNKAKNNPSTQMQKTSTPVQMRPRNTHEYQPTGHAYTKPELLVALDIDDTLVDTSQRMRSARRMGLFDPKQVGKKQHPKGRQAFLEFFYSSDRFSLDKPIQGAVDYAYSLVQQGYKIAYITGRPDYTYELTKAQLRNLGFPLTNDKYGATLLYCKPEAAKDTPSWKKNILSSLQNNYDVRFFFDNNPKNLEAARQLNIPGLYLAIDQYTGITALANRFKKVPAHLDNPGHDVSSYRRAAGCIVQRATDKKVLLLRRSPMETSMHGMYELPGGKLEEGETPKQAAKVETKEEAGMDVKIVKELTPVHVDHDMKKCYHCFLARPKKGAKVVLSEEHDHFVWVTPEQALTMTEPLSHHAEHFFRVMTGAKSNPHHEDEDEEAYKDMFDESPWANPPGIVPIMTGEPTGKHTKLGTVFSEVFIGRNIGADVGEVVQAIYRGIIGGRTSLAEKRMAMAVATMQKELSDKAVELGANGIANLKIDYEIPKGTASVTLIAHGDAIKTGTVRNNPGGGKATKLYREFNGKAPDKVEKTNIQIPTTLVRVGEGGCWSVGYRSDKEGHGEKQKYIHEFGDFGRFPKKKPKKGHRKEPDLYAALDEKGNVIDLRIIGGTFSLDIDPDTGINWLVG